MKTILIALAIGISAGLVDVIPMIFQKLNKTACWSAFTHWLVLGLVIPFVDWNVDPWLKGLIIGELSALPILIIVSKQDKKAVIPIIGMSAILGIGVGMAGAYFIS